VSCILEIIMELTFLYIFYQQFTEKDSEALRLFLGSRNFHNNQIKSEKKERSRRSILHKDILNDSDTYRYGVVTFLIEIIKHSANWFGL
jgi:tRNA U38,U39,U40 pseudouridine synthase TruA